MTHNIFKNISKLNVIKIKIRYTKLEICVTTKTMFASTFVIITGLNSLITDQIPQFNEILYFCFIAIKIWQIKINYVKGIYS